MQFLVHPFGDPYKLFMKNYFMLVCFRLLFYYCKIRVYQIETGVEIHKARIELLVKTKEPKLRVFEFELDDLKVKVDAILLHIKEVLEYWNNGVPASVLFGFNPESFRGSELKEFLDF